MGDFICWSLESVVEPCLFKLPREKMFQVSRGFKLADSKWLEKLGPGEFGSCLSYGGGGGGFESTEFQLAGFYCTIKHHVIQEQHDFW